MKKFILKITLFFALVVVMDVALGEAFSILRAHAKGGSTANCEYIAERAKDDIIIMGSSRATHHYVTQMIEDTLGVTCYNCAEEGNGIVLAYGRYQMLKSRYTPKLIIYEMTPGYDYGADETTAKYLGYLRPYYYKEGIRQLFEDFDDDLSFLKMKSQMYRNTGKLLPNIVDNVLFRDNQKGYSPLFGTMDISNIKVNAEEAILSVDSVKLSYVERLIKDAQSVGIPIIFMISPKYGGKNSLVNYLPEIRLCEKYNVPYYNYMNDVSISNNPNYFQDYGHMNDEGATAYTKLIVKEVINKNLYN